MQQRETEPAGPGRGSWQVSWPPWWAWSPAATCHRRAPVACVAHLARQDPPGREQGKGRHRHRVPGASPGCGGVQKEGKEPWEILESQARRAGESGVWGRKRDAEGGGERHKRPRSGQSGIGKGYGGTGMLRGEGWGELVWFSMDLGRDAGLEGEGEVLWAAQLGFLLVCIFFPFPSGWAAQVPLPGAWEGSWPAPPSQPAARYLLSPLQPPVSR